MQKLRLRLSAVDGTFAVCRLPSDALVPAWAMRGSFWTVTRTQDELSIVCPDSEMPLGVECEPGWRCIKVQGPLGFAMVGVMASLVQPLAEAGISLFAVSTFDTDYLMVKKESFQKAVDVLAAAGHNIPHRGASK